MPISRCVASGRILSCTREPPRGPWKDSHAQSTQAARPVIITAVLVSALMAGKPALAQAAKKVVNADKVDGKHAVGAGASVEARAGKLVATNKKGTLPNNIISTAADSAKLGGKSLGNLASIALSHTDDAYASQTPNRYCDTMPVTVTQASLAFVDVSLSALGGNGGTDFAVRPVVSDDGWTTYSTSPGAGGSLAGSAPQGKWATVAASSPFELTAGKTYSFGAWSHAFTGSGSTDGSCSVTVQIVPKLPGGRIIYPGAPTAH